MCAKVSRSEAATNYASWCGGFDCRRLVIMGKPKVFGRLRIDLFQDLVLSGLVYSSGRPR